MRTPATRSLAASLALSVPLVVLLSTMAGAAPRTDEKWRLSGPYVHKNLAVYVVRGRSTDGRRFLTLGEGLAAKTVIVREKGAGGGSDQASVNELEVENRSDHWLFLQAGDVVRGGKQDRTIAIDVTLAPHSAPQPIDAFCVEHGRWAPKADGLQFSAGTAIVSGNALKRSIQEEKNQGRVWEEVAKKDRAAARLVAEASPGSAPMPSLSSSGTYNAIVDRAEVRGSREEFVRALAPKLLEADALGIVVAIDGKITAADVYASHALFRKLSGKLLDSYALEAALSAKSAGSVPAPRLSDVRAFLTDPSTAEARSEKLAGKMHRRTRESRDVLLYEYSDSSPATAEPVHRTYLSKSASN